MKEKLRTLKDLQKDFEWNFDTYKELKQEAIKYVKLLEKKIKRCKCGNYLILDKEDETYLTCPVFVLQNNKLFEKENEENFDGYKAEKESEKLLNKHDTTYELSSNPQMTKNIFQIEFIIHFFNLKEEDLKEV